MIRLAISKHLSSAGLNARAVLIVLALAFVGLPKHFLDAQEQTQPAEYARQPKEIAFQNDSQWEDSRIQQTELGPFFAGTIKAQNGLTLKGLAIRVGDQRQATVLYDTARLRMSAAWQGGFLKFGPRRFALISPPQADGKHLFSASKKAGWATDGRFDPAPEEITLPEVEAGYTGKGSSVTQLPEDWARYRGFFTHGDHVILHYDVAGVRVLESPSFVSDGEASAIVRTFEVAASEKELKLWIGDNQSVHLVGSNQKVAGRARLQMNENAAVVRIMPGDAPVLFQVLSAEAAVERKTLQSLANRLDSPLSLESMTKSDPGRFAEELRTVGVRSESNEPYVIDTLTLPFVNPWKALFFTAGHDFFSDGSGAVCTVHGDVWTVQGIDDNLTNLRWRRFATGLCQPLGLKIIDDQIYVIGRNQITRLSDRNDDGEADYYECFSNDLFITPRAHDYVTCLETDPQGNFYFIHAKTGVMRVDPSGRRLTQIADGFRNPNGLGVGPNGIITAAPQQGTWTPESSLIEVRPEGYYGYAGPRISDQRPSGWDLPLCFIPRAMDNSGGGQVWSEGDRWGPLKDQLLHLSYGQCRILLTLREEVTDTSGRITSQGASIRFPTEPADFESGIMRGRFHPSDGQLYVSGLRGWQTRAIRDGCLQRVRYTGQPVTLPVAFTTFRNGIKLTFSEALDPDLAGDPDRYFAEQWNYIWSSAYGSADYSVANPKQPGRDEVSILSATVMDEGRAVFLEMNEVAPVHQMAIHWLLKSTDGQDSQGELALTVNVAPTKEIPESQIVRKPRKSYFSQEEEQHLAPGIAVNFKSLAGEPRDTRRSRLVAWHGRVDQPHTPWVPAGPFRAHFEGSLRVPLSGFYQFRVVGNGVGSLQINDQEIVPTSGWPAQTNQPVLLRKGHNQLSLHWNSPLEGMANLKLEWKSTQFDWEPVPPSTLFHDSRSLELSKANLLRTGRELFANHHCAACHQVDHGSNPMFELTMPAPDIRSSGRRFSQAWLAHWIQSPSSLREQSTMPHMLPERGREEAAADLVAYLVETAAELPTARVSDGSTEDSIALGENLFEDLGCIQCHHFETPGFDDPHNRISLHYTNAKFVDSALVQFLKEPDLHAVATRMPRFDLSDADAQALANYLRKNSAGQLAAISPGNSAAGSKRFRELGCIQCHAGPDQPMQKANLSWPSGENPIACLSGSKEQTTSNVAIPLFEWSERETTALQALLADGQGSLGVGSPSETSLRLVERLGCTRCHDYDGRRSDRQLILAEEGSGRVAETIPSLTWAGEKLRHEWLENAFRGANPHKSRPWIKAQMPAFSGYAAALAKGMAEQHGVSDEDTPFHTNMELAQIGEQLTLKTGLDCRQCHGIGELQPQGDQQTRIAQGINFREIKQRMRQASYHRFMLDPTRFDRNTNMIKLSENGLTTKLKSVFDADARQQFDALWHYIQSLPE